MKRGIKRILLPACMSLCALIVMAGPLTAATYNLRAAAATMTMADGKVVPVWGFADDSGGAGTGTVTVPGPRLNVAVGDSTLTINLKNNLTVPVSLVIPGL